MIALIRRDVMLAFRSGGGFGLALGFFLIVVVLLPLAVGPDTTPLRLIAPGVLWLGALLACLLSLDRMFSQDFEDGTLEVLATAPLPLATIVLAKATAHWLTSCLPLVLAAPVLGVMLNFPGSANGVLVASLLVGTPSLSFIGAFGAALTVGVKRGGLLLSLLVLPLYVPTLIFGATAARLAAEGQSASQALAATAAISLLTAALLPFAGAAVLRINLR